MPRGMVGVLSVHTPERRPAPGPQMNLSMALRVMPVTCALIAVNAVFFLLETQWGGSESGPTLFRMGAITPLSTLRGTPETLITSGYLHIGIVHVVVNMYALSGLGRAIEPMLGSGRYFVLYTLSLMGSGLFIHAFSRGLTAGASGAIFGVLGAFVVVMGLAHQRATVPEQRAAIRQQIAWLLLPNVVISLMPGISFAGHAGGLLTGAVFVLVAYLRGRGASTPERARQRTRFMNVTAAGLAVLSIVAVMRLWALYEPWRALEIPH